MTMSEELLDDRGHDYGRAWYLESLLLDKLNDYHTNDRELDMWYSAYQGPWRAIMAKMVRLLESPEHVDSWADVEGYARLARRHIKDGVWHGEEEVPETKYTGQMTATFSSSCVQSTLPFHGSLENDGDGGLVIKDMVEVERAEPGEDNIILGMATENVRAGDIVQIARKMEVRND